jgi:hypothetical protein
MTDFDGLTTPRPPARLRATTLLAARRAASVATPAPPWRVFLTEFVARPLWTAALIVLILAHATLGFFVEGKRATPIETPRDREVAAQPDLLRLPHVARPAGDLPLILFDVATADATSVGGRS